MGSITNLFKPKRKTFHPDAVPEEDTRRAAFEDALEREPPLREKCLAVLADAMLTADEVAEKIGESILSVRPTITRLIQEGVLTKTPLRRRNLSGKMATVVAVA